MNCILDRGHAGDSGVFGILSTEDGDQLCYTLERTFPQPDGSLAPKMPVGTYQCRRYLSPHFGYVVFEICDVPGHDNIEIHKANWEYQLNGCVALGESVAEPMLCESGRAFESFMTLQRGCDEFTLVVK